VLNLLAMLSPLLVVATLLAIYLADRDFYLAYVLEAQHREYQAVEMATVSLATLAGLMLLGAAATLWRRSRDAAASGGLTGARGFSGIVARHGATLIVLAVGGACLFLAAEEVSWGQTFQYWGVPEREKPISHETNLHNNLDLPLQSVGQAFLVLVFFGLPIAWAFRDRLGLPASLRPAVAEAPVIVAAAAAFAWKLVKEIYVGVRGKPEGDAFYWGFIEQINEQKELLVALALFLYACYRVRAVVRLRRGEQDAD
jgi:hypothetical protein